MWDIIIPILTFILGLIVGAVFAARALKKQMSTMQNDPKQIEAIAKSMGVKLNQKQLNKVTRQMQGASKEQKPKSRIVAMTFCEPRS